MPGSDLRVATRWAFRTAADRHGLGRLRVPGMFGTSRRIGAFSILASIVWIGLSVGIVLGD
jgi:hypothetical protein